MDFSDLVRMFGYGASPDAGFSLPPDYSGLVQSQTGTADPTRARPMSRPIGFIKSERYAALVSML